MKRWLFLIPLLFISNLYADSITSGVGLILPTTGVVDLTKSWATKYNENFNVIAGTIVANINDINIIESRLDNVAASTASIGSTLANTLDNTSSTQTKTGGLIVNAMIKADDFSGSGRLLTGITAASISSGTFNDTFLRQYNIVVGTLTASNVDIATNIVENALNAVNSICINRDCSVLFQSGVYQLGVTTAIVKVSTGISVYAIPGSSTVWAMTSNTSSGVVVYGGIDGISFDLAGKSYSGLLVDQRFNSRFTNNKIYNSLNLSIDNGQLIRIENSTKVVNENNYYDNFAIYFEGTFGKAPFGIVNSTYVSYKNNYFGNTTDLDSGIGRVLVVLGGDYLDIQNNNITECGGECVGITGFSNIPSLRIQHLNFSGNKITSPVGTQANPGALLTFVDGSVDMNFSTTVVVDNNDFYITGNGTSGQVIDIRDQTGTPSGSVVISNNRVHSIGNSTAWTFLAVRNSAVHKTLINGNKVFGINTFISDSGTGTAYTGLGNFLNGVEQ